MATEIERQLGELQEEIRRLGTSLSEAGKEARDLNKSIKLDSGNVSAVRQRFATLAKTVELNAQKVTALKKQQELLNQQFKSGAINANQYNKSYQSTQKKIEAAEKSMAEMTAELKQQDAAIRSSQLDRLNNKLTKVQNTARTVSRAVLGITAAMAGAVTAFVAVGDNLDDTSRKWQISAEQLQTQNNLFDKITEAPKGYEDALTSLGSVMSSIARGRGAAYLNTLKKLGIAQEDLNGINTAELYDKVYEALRQVDDETERAVLAQQLMGETGLNVALVAGTSAEQIAKLNEDLARNGIISSEQAASAGLVSDTLADIKIKAMSVFASLATSMYPIITTIFAFVTETVLPILQRVADWLGNMSPAGQRFVLVLAIVLIFLPKIIGFVKMGIGVFKTLKAATLAQAAATGALGAASTPLVPLFIIIAGVVLLVATLMAVFSKSARDATKSVNSLLASSSELEGTYSGMQYDVAQSNYSYAESRNTTNSNINVNIKAEGDTPIDKQNADWLDEQMLGLINRALGGKA